MTKGFVTSLPSRRGGPRCHEPLVTEQAGDVLRDQIDAALRVGAALSHSVTADPGRETKDSISYCILDGVRYD
jgi:hypothetical protein